MVINSTQCKCLKQRVTFLSASNALSLFFLIWQRDIKVPSSFSYKAVPKPSEDQGDNGQLLKIINRPSASFNTPGIIFYGIPLGTGNLSRFTHLLKNTYLSLDGGVLDRGPALTHPKNWLICYGCTCKRRQLYFAVLSQTTTPSDFSLIVAGLINADPFGTANTHMF